MVSRRDVAGLLMTHYSDRPWDDPAAERDRVLREVSSLGVAGYCLFGGEVERTRAFNAKMAAAAGGPLLVASDLEQGLGQQLEGGTVFPSRMAVGAAGSADLAERIGRAVALEARSVGINVVFAPVADLATEPSNPIIGVRAYGAAPEAVAKLTEAYVRGCQSGGVAATAKHFPGHGDTVVDSHIDLPVVAADRRTLDERELVPFRAALAVGVKVVMVSHVAFAALAGPGVPATLAPSVGEKLLRGELGFGGLVVTDALLMGAIAKRYGSAEAAVKALLAGADLLLMPEDTEDAIAGLAAAVESGRVTEERVSSSLERISDLRAWLSGASDRGGDGRGDGAAGRSIVDLTQEHDLLARDVARLAVTLVANDGSVPLEASSYGDGIVVVAALIDAERPPDLEPVRALLGERMPGTTLRTFAGDGAVEELEDLVSDAGSAGVFVLLVFDAPAAWRGRKGPTDALVSAAGRALEAASRSAAVVFGGPELVPLFPQAGAVLCCYDGSPHMQEAALDVLAGYREATGALPPAPVPNRPGRGA